MFAPNLFASNPVASSFRLKPSRGSGAPPAPAAFGGGRASRGGGLASLGSAKLCRCLFACRLDALKPQSIINSNTSVFVLFDALGLRFPMFRGPAFWAYAFQCFGASDALARCLCSESLPGYRPFTIIGMTNAISAIKNALFL